MTARGRAPTAAAVAVAVAVATLVVLLVAPARPARAGLLVEHIQDGDACAEAATYPQSDTSPEARRAYRRCRLVLLERALEDQRRGEAELRIRRQPEVVQAWMERHAVPARVLRRNAIDGFVGVGVVGYGLALAGVFLPSLEVEAWVGWGHDSAYTFTSDVSAQIDANRRCLGGRAKWLMVDRRNVTPFLSGGVAGCQASLQYFDFSGGNSGEGHGIAHHVTVSGGMSWTSQGGFRFSVEYLYMRAFYVQASRNDPMATHDDNMRKVFDQSLTDDRHGIRFQVGYAF